MPNIFGFDLPEFLYIGALPPDYRDHQFAVHKGHVWYLAGRIAHEFETVTWSRLNNSEDNIRILKLAMAAGKLDSPANWEPEGLIPLLDQIQTAPSVTMARAVLVAMEPLMRGKHAKTTA